MAAAMEKVFCMAVEVRRRFVSRVSDYYWRLTGLVFRREHNGRFRGWAGYGGRQV